MKTHIHMKNTCIVISALCLSAFLAGCELEQQQKPVSDSGVRKTSVRVATGSDGLTAEQRNVAARLMEDNKPGAIKHLYIISPYSGQVILYSTVAGKVTSGWKRLSPTSIVAAGSGDFRQPGYQFNDRETSEALPREFAAYVSR